MKKKNKQKEKKKLRIQSNKKKEGQRYTVLIKVQCKRLGRERGMIYEKKGTCMALVCEW